MSRPAVAAILHRRADRRTSRWRRGGEGLEARRSSDEGQRPSARSAPARHSSNATCLRRDCRWRLSVCSARVARRGRRHCAAVSSPAWPGDAGGVEDHDDGAVAEDGVAAEHRHVAQDRCDRLDDDLLGVEHPVDDDAERLAPTWRSRPCRPCVRRSRRVQLQQGRQADQRQQAIAQAQHRRMPSMISIRVSAVRARRTSSTTLICGIAKRSPPPPTISAETMASVSGILIVKVVPLPAHAVAARSVPPIFSMLVLTTSMPTPRPETAVTARRWRSPG